MTVRDQVFSAPGYCTDIKMPVLEMIDLREMVVDSYHIALYDIGIENYGNHKATFPKEKRLLSMGAVDCIKRMSFMTQLRREFGDVKLTSVMLPDETVEKRDEVYWRIVRPNEPTDVGAMHRDNNFHAFAKSRLYPYKELVKCWIPLWCEKDCGLYVYPNSMLGSAIEPRVLFDEQFKILLFNSRTLHGGMVNAGKTARVSMEITLVVDA